MRGSGHSGKFRLSQAGSLRKMPKSIESCMKDVSSRERSRRDVLTGLLGCGLVILTGKGYATEPGVISVPNDYPTISEALSHVREGGVIELEDGVYEVPFIKGITLDETVPKNLTFRSKSKNPQNCVIDCDLIERKESRRGFTLWDRNNIGSYDTIEGIKIINGTSSGLGEKVGTKYANAGGGGILAINSKLNVLNCILDNNSAKIGPRGENADGGGICATDGSYVVIRGCLISNNSASHAAAGIAIKVNSTGIIDANVVRDNSAWDCWGGGGMGFVGNSYGVISNNLIIRNIATNDDDLASGGGISLVNSGPDIINNTFYGNKPEGMGGGIYVGLYPRPKIIANNIFWGNIAKTGTEDFYDIAIRSDNIPDLLKLNMTNNLVGKAIDPKTPLINPDALLIVGNPMFYNYNGGDFRLRQGSPCIDRGVWIPGMPSFDLAGNKRVRNGRPCMGCYEVQPPEKKATYWMLD